MKKRSQLRQSVEKMDTPLDTKQLNMVVATALNAKERWYKVGSALSIDAKQLSAISTRHKKSADAEELCFYEIIQIWLQSKKPKSWKILVNILRSRKVDLETVAKEIERSECIFMSLCP